MDDVTIDRERKEQKKINSSGSIKILFSIIKGRWQYFYIGGDVAKPREIYRRECIDLASPLQDTNFGMDGYATVCSKAYLTNTGKAKNDWLVALHYEDIDELQPENTLTIQYLSPKISAKNPKFKHQYFECFGSVYQGSGFFVTTRTATSGEYEETSESNSWSVIGGPARWDYDTVRTSGSMKTVAKNAFYSPSKSYMRNFSGGNENKEAPEAFFSNDVRSGSENNAYVSFFKDKIAKNLFSSSLKYTYGGSADRSFGEDFTYEFLVGAVGGEDGTEISGDKYIAPNLSKAFNRNYTHTSHTAIDTRAPFKAIENSTYSSKVAISIFCGGEDKGLYRYGESSGQISEESNNNARLKYFISEKGTEKSFDGLKELEAAITKSKSNFTQVNFNFYKVNPAVAPIPDPPPVPLPPQVNIPVDIWTKNVEIPVDCYRESGEYAKTTETYKSFSFGYTDKDLPPEDHRMIHEYSFYPPKK